MSATWVIDWNKVTTIEHIKALLISAEMQPNKNHHSFDSIKDLCKQIDADGKEIKETE